MARARRDASAGGHALAPCVAAGGLARAAASSQAGGRRCDRGRLREHRRSGAALGGALRRGGQGAAASAVRQLPSGSRPAAAGRGGPPHEPWVRRGADGHGVGRDALHGRATPAANFDAVAMPGHPNWHLAPASMAWQGKSLRQICAQIKDPDRNGGAYARRRSSSTWPSDSLVGWAWSPGVGREPAPGTQAAFGALIEAWADTGAVCPERQTWRTATRVSPVRFHQVLQRKPLRRRM